MVNQERFSRQIPVIGKHSQERLEKAKVAVVGCGALGNTVASMLVRAGVGFVRLIDGDAIEVSNLPRTPLFESRDVGRSKAITLKTRIGTESEVDAQYQELRESNKDLLIGFDLVMDCTDNMGSRFLINKICYENKIPWVYGAVEGNQGFSSSFNRRPCFRCLYPKKPPVRVGLTPVMNYLPSLVGSWQVAEGIRILTEYNKPNYNKLFHFDLDKGTITKSILKVDKKCKVCSK